MKSELEHLLLNEKRWDKWAENYDKKSLLQDKLRQAQRSVIYILDVNENINFLDVGCGTGYAIGEAAKLVNGKGEFYGIDLSSKIIEKAKDNYRDKSNFHFIKANVESIPLNDNFFNIIICTYSFHHYLNPDKALKEIYRLLKKGGKVYILDPTSDKWYVNVINKIIKLFEPEHVKKYSTAEFRLLFQNAGLKYSFSKEIKGNDKVHIAEKR